MAAGEEGRDVAACGRAGHAGDGLAELELVSSAALPRGVSGSARAERAGRRVAAAGAGERADTGALDRPVPTDARGISSRTASFFFFLFFNHNNA